MNTATFNGRIRRIPGANGDMTINSTSVIRTQEYRVQDSTTSSGYRTDTPFDPEVYDVVNDPRVTEDEVIDFAKTKYIALIVESSGIEHAVQSGLGGNFTMPTLTQLARLGDEFPYMIFNLSVEIQCPSDECLGTKGSPFTPESPLYTYIRQLVRLINTMGKLRKVEVIISGFKLLSLGGLDTQYRLFLPFFELCDELHLRFKVLASSYVKPLAIPASEVEWCRRMCKDAWNYEALDSDTESWQMVLG